jgi:hypothetical protein
MPSETGFQDLGKHTPHRVLINTASDSLDAVAAVAGKSIRVIALSLSVASAAEVQFNSDTTEIGRTKFKSADPAIVWPRNSDGWLQTTPGEKFNITNTTGAMEMQGVLIYVLI